MQNGLKKLSPSIFIIAIVCFFLPFVNFTCEGMKYASLTGVQLVTGTTVKMPSSFGKGSESEKVNSEPLAVLVFLSCVIGLLLSLIKGMKSAIAPAIIAFVGLILLLLLKAKLDNEVLREGGGIVQLEYGTGFWLTFLLFLIAVGLNGFLFSQKKKYKASIKPNLSFLHKLNTKTEASLSIIWEEDRIMAM